MTMVGFTEENQCRSQWQSGVCKQCHWQSDCATLIRLKSTLEMLCKGLPLLIPTPYSRYRSGFLTILFRGAILMKKTLQIRVLFGAVSVIQSGQWGVFSR